MISNFQSSLLLQQIINYLNKQIAQMRDKKKIPVNVVDQPALCTFTMGSIVERGSLWSSLFQAVEKRPY